MINAKIELVGKLEAVKHTPAGPKDLGVLSQDKFPVSAQKPPDLKNVAKDELKNVLKMGALAFLASQLDLNIPLALVTTAGVNYMAADFAVGANVINDIKYHDAGTGTTGAAIGDTALETPWGGSRVVGIASNPTANQYRSEGTISFTGSFAITEWGILSASSSGTLWDRRVFSAINVVNGNAITFLYTLTIPAGGT